MATTLTAAALMGDELVVAHVGDTRAYLLHEGRLEQLTHDQTVVQSLVDDGLLTPEAARTHPLRSHVLGSLHGADDDLDHLVTIRRPVVAGDRILVCSDGLSGVVPGETLERLLQRDSRPAAAATRLVRAALAAGTHDNVTAVVADVHVAAPAQAYRAGATCPVTFVA
jgi:protein phosphatase